MALRRLVAEVDDHELAREGAPPTPADELPPRLVAVPPSPLGARPRALAEDVVSQEREQQLVERPQVVVDRLVGPAAEKDGQVHLPALELALVDEPRAGLAQCRDRGRARLRRGEGRRRPRLVVVLDEADEPPLVFEVGAEVPVHAVGALVHEAVVEPLVVAVVEALLLERPLQIPVRLGDEHEAGAIGLDRADQRGPVLVRRPRRRASTPRPLEHVVRHEHRHVAAHAVALARESSRGSPLTAPRRSGENASSCTTSGHAGKYGSRPVRDDELADADERPRVALEVGLVAADEVLGMRLQPRMVRGDVVRDEVEDQPQPVPGERLARGGEPVRPAEAVVHDVVADAVGRADDVGRRDVGQGTLEALEQSRVRAVRSRCPPGCAPTRP